MVVIYCHFMREMFLPKFSFVTFLVSPVDLCSSLAPAGPEVS